MNWSREWNKPVTSTTPSPQSNPKPSPFPDWDSKSQDDVLLEWQSRQRLLTVAKEREMEFRKYVVTRAFVKPEEGTNTLDLGNGYSLKAAIKYNYKLADNDTVEKGLGSLAKIGNQGSFVADRLVSWTPNFLLTEYRVIQEDANKGSVEAIEMMKVITSFLTITEAAPSLTISEPKVKK